MAEIGVGVIGTGFMGEAHARAMQTVVSAFEPALRPHLALVADLDAERAAATARRFGFARSTADWRSLVADPAVGLVSVTSPNMLHKEMALAAIAAGKHVWCEKPLALTATDAAEMARAATAAGVVTLVGYNYLRSPAAQYVRRLVETGELGELTYLRVVFDEDYMASADVPFSWRCERATAGHGALGDLGSHAIGMARFLAGEIVAVAADTSTVLRDRMAAGGGLRPVENDDITHAILRFRSGLIGSLATSRVAWGRRNGPDIELFGTRGSVRFTQERMNELQLFRPAERVDDNGFRTILTGPAHPPFGRFTPAGGHGLGFNDLKTAEAAHLLDAIATGGPAWPDFAEGACIEAVAEAIVLAAEQRAWVDVRGP